MNLFLADGDTFDVWINGKSETVTGQTIRQALELQRLVDKCEAKKADIICTENAANYFVYDYRKTKSHLGQGKKILEALREAFDKERVE